MIICSSRTTGLSKGEKLKDYFLKDLLRSLIRSLFITVHCEIGVRLSHAALLEATSPFNHFSGICSCDDVLLCFSSLYWLSGLLILLKSTFCGSTQIITTKIFAPDLQLHLIEKYKVTQTFNAPHHFVLMMKSANFSKTDLSSLKYALVGGAKVPLHVKNKMSYHLPNGSVTVGYGMSETSCMLSFDCPISDKDTVGRLVNGVQMKIIDVQGNKCGINEDGEICVKVHHEFLGYYANQATQKLLDEEGFIMSGDIGHFDEDGDLFIVDRKKDLLKYCGFQISPSEIDAYLIESSEIQSACTVGIPDEMASDLLAAVIVRARGSKLSEKEVYDLVAGSFARH